MIKRGIFFLFLISACGDSLLDKKIRVFPPPQVPSANGSLNLTDVDQNNLRSLLNVSERYSPSGKENYRNFWLSYFKNLGIPTQVLPYTTAFKIGETQGHNMEAVLTGSSPDSIVIIVHYDSMGEPGKETENPAVDDNMTGMAIMLETARLLASQKEYLHYTIRFVATDYEEEGNPDLEGARQYAQYIQALSKALNFKIVAAIGPDQTGWNCFKNAECGDASQGRTFDFFACSEDDEKYDANSFGDMFSTFVSEYSNLQTERSCTIDDSDAYAMWEIGVPSLIFAEHNPEMNPYFDQEGSDTLDKIDFNYFSQIAQISSAFIARLAGVNIKK